MREGGPDYDHDTVLTFPYHTERRARTVHDSVAVEVGEIDDDRSTVSVSRDDRTVAVRIRAKDLVSLRAGTNSWMRLVSVAEDVAGFGGDDAGDSSPGDSRMGDETDVVDENK